MARKAFFAAFVIDEEAYTPEPGPVDCRDHLSPTMRETLAFEYFEVRPCIERDRQVTSYRR